MLREPYAGFNARLAQREGIIMAFEYEHLIVDIPDFPKPGIIFKDITPVLADAQGFAAVVEGIANHFADCGITKVVAAEARGFMVGAPVAYKLGAGFVPARKPGKLPRETYSKSFMLEYGEDALEIHRDALSADDVVLIVDDLVATGGTNNAMADLVRQAGAKLAGMGFFMELAFLEPRAAIAKETDAEVLSLYVVE